MNFGDGDFVGGEVPRLASLTRLEFLERYRGRMPFVLAGGAARSRAFRLWSPEYLAERWGTAQLEVLVHVYELEALASDYARAGTRVTDLASFLRDHCAGKPGTGYLINSQLAVFRADARDPELRVGRGRQANPELAGLSDDFELPSFLTEEDLVYSALFLGSSRDKSPLHYDRGGEGKTLTQIRGRKRVLLFAPDQLRHLYVRGLFEPSRTPFDQPFVSRVNLRAPDFERFPALREARALEAVLEPGDILYWPPFWLHDFTNLDDPTIAAVCILEELRPTAMLARELVLCLCSELERRFRARGEQPTPETVRAFEELESLLLSPELAARKTMWGWFDAALSGP